MVFDLVSRLVDKNLVVTEERPGGEQHYRLLETLRAYAIERARVAGELGVAPGRAGDVLAGLARAS